VRFPHRPKYHWRLALYDGYVGFLKSLRFREPFGIFDYADQEFDGTTRETLIDGWIRARAEFQRELEQNKSSGGAA